MKKHRCANSPAEHVAQRNALRDRLHGVSQFVLNFHERSAG